MGPPVSIFTLFLLLQLQPNTQAQDPTNGKSETVPFVLIILFTLRNTVNVKMLQTAY